MPSLRTSAQLKAAAYSSYQQGKLKKASSLFNQAIKLDKLDAESWLSLGIIKKEMSLFSEAERCFRKLIRIQPDNGEAYCHLGMVLEENKQPEKAISCLNKAIKINPDDPWFHFILANLYETLGNNNDAVEHYRQALFLDAEYAQAYVNLGLVLVALGELEQAIKNYNKAIALMPEEPAAHNNLGLALSKMGEHERAISSFLTAIRLNPDISEIHNNLGNAFLDIRNREQAVKCYSHVLTLNSQNDEAYANRGLALLELGRLEEARASFQQAIDINPKGTSAVNNMGSLMMELGLPAKALAYFQKSLEIDPEQPSIRSNILLTLNYLSKYSEQTIFEMHLQSMAEQNSSAEKQRKYTSGLPSNRSIKVGYISSDLHLHPVAQFLEPILKNHNLSAFDIYCYADVQFPDKVTRRLQSLVSNWQNIYGKKDIYVADLIHENEIDILIDLAGHTGGNRLGVFNLKPAPVQISYLGYANTTGLQCMDYRITDIYVDPEGETEQFYSEKLLRLPESFCCYQPAVDSPEISPPPVLVNKYITFGSFNHLLKINPEVIKLWASILNQVENSRLLLKTGGLHEEKTRQRIKKEFLQHGIPADRLILEGKDKQYLERYNQVDIGLDPFPWNGGTTSFDMVWMSVPFITLAGDSYRSRMGLAILENLKLADLVASDYDDYIGKAVALASNTTLLQQLHAELRERMTNSPLMNAPQFTKQLEAAYQYAYASKRG